MTSRNLYVETEADVPSSITVHVIGNGDDDGVYFVRKDEPFCCGDCKYFMHIGDTFLTMEEPAPHTACEFFTDCDIEWGDTFWFYVDATDYCCWGRIESE